ncbi:MAG: carboxypeptidase regulatory-like domain-containing protein [Acidobacteriota bacterium]
MRLRPLFLFLGIALLAAPFALSQTTGSVSGVARDTNGSPLPGVLVSISGPQMPVARTVTTRSDGAFQFFSLIPGTYQLKAELQGLGTFAQDVVVQLGKDTEVRPVLAATAAESVEVTAALPLVDTKASDVAVVTDRTTIEKLPLARTFSGTFQLAPGVADSGVAISNTNVGVNAGGGRQDNVYLYDGVNVTNPFFGDLYQDFAELDIQEVSFTRGGVSAESGRTGGLIINGVTKSGTNNFHGEARIEYQPSGLNAESKDPSLTSTFNRVRPGAAVGGPIARDYLFFYGSANFFRQTEKDRFTHPFDTPTSLPDSDLNIDEYFGKLTGQPAPSVLLDASFRYRGIEQTNADILADGTASTGDNPKEIDRVGVASAFWTVMPNFNVEAKYNHNELIAGATPVTPLGYQPPFDPLHPENVGRFLTATATQGGSTLAINDDNFFRDEFRLSTSYLSNFLGASHDIRLGGTLSLNKEELARIANGWGDISILTSSSNCGPENDSRCYRARYSPDQPAQISRGRTWGIFLQDQATWNRLTLNIGVLLNEDIYIPNDDQKFTFVQGDFTVPNSRLLPCTDPNHDPLACTFKDRLTIPFSKQIQPRVGVAYEISPAVHDKIYANFARYDNLDNQSIARAAAPLRLYRTDAFFNLTTGAFIKDVIRSNNTGKIVLPNIDPTYTDEYLLGYARPLGGGWSAEIWGMYRKTQDVIEDFAATGNNFEDQNPANFRYGNIPGKREYKAGTIQVRKVTGDWTADLSYTLSRLQGNWDLDYATQLFYASSYIEDGPGINVQDPNRNGILIGNRTHLVKLFATYRLPTNTILGGYFRFQSGRPWEARGFDPVYGTPYLYLEKAGTRTTSSWANFDISAAQDIPIRPVTLRLAVAVRNLFNSQPALTVNQEVCREEPCLAIPPVGDPNRNPDFGRATSYAPARQVRFTAAVSF